jgi:hypothetical protein
MNYFRIKIQFCLSSALAHFQLRWIPVRLNLNSWKQNDPANTISIKLIIQVQNYVK